MVPSAFAGFVDASFLRAEGARALGESPRNVRLDAEAVVDWYKEVAYRGSGTFMRAYWYDARFDNGHDHSDAQQRFFTALAQTAGIQLRLGRIVEHRPWFEPGIRDALTRTAQGLGLDPTYLMDEFDRNWTFRPERKQKGVDTLVALDLVRLSGRGVFDTAILISGDRDLAEAIRAAQELGSRVLVATPDRYCVSREVIELADSVIEISDDRLHRMLPNRFPANKQAGLKAISRS